MLSSIRLPNELGLHAAQAEHRAFMHQLFRSTREHLYSMPMPRQFIDTLVDQQYQLQQAAYARQFPNARTLIVQLSDEAIGKIILDENETILHIVDFAIEPGMRGRGYGTAVLRAIQAGTEKCRGQIRLSVDRQNLPARGLYRRLGFQVSATSDTHESMTSSPSDIATVGVRQH